MSQLFLMLINFNLYFLIEGTPQLDKTLRPFAVNSRTLKNRVCKKV